MSANPLNALLSRLDPESDESTLCREAIAYVDGLHAALALIGDRAVSAPSENNRTATQRTAVLGVLIDHCGWTLTPDRVEVITKQLLREMTTGPCAWAFQVEKFKPEVRP